MEEDILIVKIDEESIAEELDIEAGDKLLTINGKKPRDILEYRYLINDEFLLVEIQKANGEIWQLEIEKDYEEPLGITFQEEMIDKPKSCHNNCVFCFINQLPKGMRDTLYFKDDDTRLSFLYGNYVTLTNLSQEDIERLIEYRLEPINISVHTTNPELRVKMLHNKKAYNINEALIKFYDNKIHMNIQIVLVPEYNDGQELDKTLKDLTQMVPYINSISIVPVGLTKYRDQLNPIRTFTREECMGVIRQIDHYQTQMQEKIGKNVVYASDEFFLKGNINIPPVDYYDSFAQLENGVGMVSLFTNQCYTALEDTKGKVKEKDITVITGVLAYPIMDRIVQKIMGKYQDLNIQVVEIPNIFFGSDITVSGLVTGKDIIAELEKHQLGSQVLFPANMLRFEGDKFLDDVTVDELTEKLGVPCIPVEIDGIEFIEKLLY